MKDFCLTRDTLKEFIKLCGELLLEGGRFRVKITAWKGKRSVDQNSLYWKWLTEIAQTVEVGSSYYDNNTWHEYFKKYLCPEKIIPLPVGQTSKRSTKLLDAGEMHFYLNRIEQWAIDKMIVLPMPDDNEYLKLKNKQVE